MCHATHERSFSHADQSSFRDVANVSRYHAQKIQFNPYLLTVFKPDVSLIIACAITNLNDFKLFCFASFEVAVLN